MYGPLKKLSRVNANVQQGIAAAQRIFELLDTHTEVAQAPGAPPLAPMARSIEFRDVSFEYEDARGRSALRHVSFTVAAGQTVAIVGRSGAGKTSLVNLLPAVLRRERRRDPHRRHRHHDRDAWPRCAGQIGMVTQETVLFDDTVASNIAYGRPAASPAAIEAAARAARAHEFIEGAAEAATTP